MRLKIKFKRNELKSRNAVLEMDSKDLPIFLGFPRGLYNSQQCSTAVNFVIATVIAIGNRNAMTYIV